MRWEEYSIEQLCKKVTSGGTPLRSISEYFDGGTIPWIKTKEVNFNRIYDADEKITEKGLENSSAKLIPKNSILIAMYGDGNTAGRCAINRIPVTTNQACCNLVINDEIANSDFVFYKLATLYDIFRGLKSGGSQQNLNAKTIKEFKISVPPLPTQRRIASILSAYDDLIENNLKRIRLLEEAAGLRYKQIVREEEMEEVKLSEVAVVNESSLKSNLSLDKLIYVDIASVSTGSIDKKTEFDIQSAPSRAKRIVKHQDIIWSCVRPNRKSFSFVWKPESNLIASTGFAVISAKSIPATFLYQLVTTKEFVDYLDNNAKGATYPAVTAADFEDARIKIPTDTIMKEYHEDIYSSFEMKYILHQQNAHLREARDILLPRLMSGQVEV